MALHEHTVNLALARALRARHPRWNETTVVAEQSGTLDRRMARPDIVVKGHGPIAVGVECEFAPARTVEDDARARFGADLSRTVQSIEAVVAVRLSQALKRTSEDRLDETLENTPLAMAVFTDGVPGQPVYRYPCEGWVEGSVDDLAQIVELSALSEHRLARGTAVLERAVERAAGSLSHEEGGTCAAIAQVLNQRDGEQTRRMAMAILANAMIFHQGIAATHALPALRELAERPALLEKCWEHVVDNINYLPVLQVAVHIMKQFARTRGLRPILLCLAEAAEEMETLGATSQQDLSGQMLQRLITERKFLATFYTRPASAALLAELALQHLDCDWADPQRVQALQVADLACGTGILLSTTYRAIQSRHRRAGGDDAAIHRAMVERSLVATDIMPVATHLTAAAIASTHPQEAFLISRIATLPYGDNRNLRETRETRHKGQAALGALDLLDQSSTLPLWPEEERVSGRRTEGRKRQPPIAISDDHFDVVIMNPPFTRPTNHATTDRPHPHFSGMETPEEEAHAMSQALKRKRTPGQAGNGNAGLASHFVDLALTKAKHEDGVIALVLPASCMGGESWSATRARLARECTTLTVVALTAAGADLGAFSADTGMAEVLVVGKTGQPGDSGPTVHYLTLNRPPHNILEAVWIAHTRGEGRHAHGSLVTGDIDDTAMAGILEPELAQSARDLCRNARLPLTAQADSVTLPLDKLETLGTRGLLHRDINGVDKRTGQRRGPFDIAPLVAGEQPTLPVLWKHRAGNERRMTVQPDTKATAAPSYEKHGARVWQMASRLHFNEDFRINSQSLAACMTPQKCLGGRAWPNFQATDPTHEELLCLWANTTLGLILWWYLGTRQQKGRALITLSRLTELPVLDPRKLDKKQKRTGHAVWKKFADRPFLRAHEADRDPTRQALDRAMLNDVLNLPAEALEAVDTLRRQWCAEPTVHGGKTAPTEVRRGNAC